MDYTGNGSITFSGASDYQPIFFFGPLHWVLTWDTTGGNGAFDVLINKTGSYGWGMFTLTDGQWLTTFNGNPKTLSEWGLLNYVFIDSDTSPANIYWDNVSANSGGAELTPAFSNTSGNGMITLSGGATWYPTYDCVGNGSITITPSFIPHYAYNATGQLFFEYVESLTKL